MGRWLYALGGLLIWAVHFTGVYAIVSLGDVITRAEDLVVRAAAMAFSGLCLLAAATVTAVAVRRSSHPAEGASSFMDQLGAMGGGLSVLAIAWQTLPTITGY